jgi:hypothetical protein
VRETEIETAERNDTTPLHTTTRPHDVQQQRSGAGMAGADPSTTDDRRPTTDKRRREGWPGVGRRSGGGLWFV